MSKTLLRRGLVVTMNADEEVLEADLLVEDGIIRRIGEIEEVEGARVVDASGCAILPGFVQTHIHLCQTLMRNAADDMVLIDWLRQRIWPYEASLTFEELTAAARLGLAELVLGGTTTILDMGTVHHTDAIGAAVEDFGTRAFLGKCMMDYGELVPGPLMEDATESMRESLRLRDTWEGAAEGRIRYAFAPRFAVSCTEGLLREVADAARDLGAFIHTHASETEFENEFCREQYGCSNMEFMERVGLTGARSVFAHGVHVSDEECDLLARTRTAIAHCPSSNLKLASGIANMPRYDERGVRVSLGADGAPCNNNLDAFVEMRLAALIQKPIHGPTAMPAARVLRLATRDGAEALGIDDRVGSLEPGKDADVVVVRLDDDPGTGPGGDVLARVVYSCHRSNVRDVFVRGRQLVSRGELIDHDVAGLVADGRQALRTVTERMQNHLPR